MSACSPSSAPYCPTAALAPCWGPSSRSAIPTIDPVQRRTLQVGARLECEAVVTPTPLLPPADAETIALSIDSGHVRAVRSYQVRTFEVFVAQASNDDGEQIVFSSVPAEDDRQTKQLRGVLHRLGATLCTDLTILSDGADGPRSLGEAGSAGPTSHVLDWFHLAMRIQHVAQAVKGWPGNRNDDRQEGARFADAVEHVRWRLWHGQVQRALDLIGDTAEALDAVASPVRATGATDCGFPALPACERDRSGEDSGFAGPRRWL